MARKIDPQLVEIMKRHGGTRDDLWDCHGTWVVYHAALERMAAQAGVAFDTPDIVQPCAGEKTAVILVVGRLGDRSEWSFGEAAPANNKNAYPWAMAEKRAKDRVALKLLGLHGLHSEDEADEFKAGKPRAAPAPNAPPKQSRQEPAPATSTPFDDGPPPYDAPPIGEASATAPAKKPATDVYATAKQKLANATTTAAVNKLLDRVKERREQDALTAKQFDELWTIGTARYTELERQEPNILDAG